MNNEALHSYVIEEKIDHTFSVYIDGRCVDSGEDIEIILPVLKEYIDINRKLRVQKELHNDLILEIDGAVS